MGVTWLRKVLGTKLPILGCTSCGDHQLTKYKGHKQKDAFPCFEKNFPVQCLGLCVEHSKSEGTGEDSGPPGFCVMLRAKALPAQCSETDLHENRQPSYEMLTPFIICLSIPSQALQCGPCMLLLGPCISTQQLLLLAPCHAFLHLYHIAS